MSACVLVVTMRCGARNNRRLGRPFASGKSRVILVVTRAIIAREGKGHKAGTEAYNPPPFFGILIPGDTPA